MIINNIGELASIATSICFTIAPILFGIAGKKVGSIVVNRSRLLLALILLLLVHRIIYGNFLPQNIEIYRWGWLSLSGLIGLTLGDSAFFQALVMIGPRITLLIFAGSPILGSALGWLFLNEKLGILQIIGIFITLIGIVWVISNQEKDPNSTISKKEFGLGILFAILGAAGQALGLFTAKLGLTEGFPTLSAQIIRLFAGTFFIWIWTFFIGEAKETLKIFKNNTQAIKIILFATIIGPMIGIWFSLVSIQNTDLGIASTLQALPPIFLIPISIYIFKEKVNWQSIIGTIISLMGVGILFLV